MAVEFFTFLLHMDLRRKIGNMLENIKHNEVLYTPIPAEWCSAVAPNALDAATSAPCSIRYMAVAVCPCRAAWWRGVSPAEHAFSFSQRQYKKQIN